RGMPGAPAEGDGLAVVRAALGRGPGRATRFRRVHAGRDREHLARPREPVRRQLGEERVPERDRHLPFPRRAAAGLVAAARSEPHHRPLGGMTRALAIVAALAALTAGAALGAASKPDAHDRALARMLDAKVKTFREIASQKDDSNFKQS